MEKQSKKQFVQAIFCAPTGAYEEKPYPSRLTDEVFKALAEAGINRIFAFGYDAREETREKTFALCEKYDIKYFPTPKYAGAYTRIVPGKNGEKPFSELTEQEKQVLDQKLVGEIEKMKNHAAFGGIFFADEAGYLAFEGIAHAQKLFCKYYGEYEFHTNFYSYAISEAIFWGGMGGTAPEKLPFKLEGDLAITFENRFHFYDKLVEGLLSRGEFEFISQDKYPFECFWSTVPTSVHVALFELNAYFNQKKKKHNNKFYNYMQVGQFDKSERAMTFAEMALQMHVTAAYGSEGFAYFPGCYPLDWAERAGFSFAQNGGSSMFDLYGNKTIYCDWITWLNKFFRQIEQDILSSTHLGVEVFGTYDNGFTEEEICHLPDQECIYRGELPDMLKLQSGIKVTATNQALLSTFEQGEKKRYYIINLSTVYENEVVLELENREYDIISLESASTERGEIRLKLDAGHGVYIQEK